MTDEDRLLIEQLTSEYKIIQEKIDKIGAFRFTVRGWSVTLVVASIFAVGSTKEVSPLLLLFLIIFVLLFSSVERKQNNLSDYFGERALEIEKKIRRIIRSNAASKTPRSDIGFTPWIAYHLKYAAQRSALSGRFLRMRNWLRDPDRYFYSCQAVIVILAVILTLWYRKQNPRILTAAPNTIVQYQNTRACSRDNGIAKAGSESTVHNEEKQNAGKKPH